MKKILSSIVALVMMQAAYGQLTLSGTSYTETFDNIGAGLPAGWACNTGATANLPGTAATLTTAATTWSNTTGAFRNMASATGLTVSSTTTEQNNSTNRVFGLRQTGSLGDPGAAFVLQLANTTGFTSFQLSFLLQSLDATSARTTTWHVQYALGANPTSFTDAAVTGTLTTGGSNFSNNTITADFGHVLDNQSGPVWIRIVTLAGTGGTGSRAPMGIDDFHLSWTSGAPVNYQPNIAALNPQNGASFVPVNSNLQITFDRQITAGTGNLQIRNETDQSTHTITIPSADVSISGYTATITNVNLAMGKTYHVTFDGNAFDTAGFASYGISDTTAWVFSTPPAPATALNETFDNACNNGGLPVNWSKYNVTGAQVWQCNSTSGTTNKYITIYGATGSGASVTPVENEDWLITPQCDFTAMSNPYLTFRNRYTRTGPSMQVLFSYDYDGISNPNNATWTDLNVAYNIPADSNVWNAKTVNLQSVATQPLYLCFKYTSTTAAAAKWDVDSVVVYNYVPPTPVTVTSLNEQFDDACVQGGLPVTWQAYNVSGTQKWQCNSTSGTSNKYATIYGASGSGSSVTPVPNEDWLITPKCDLSAYGNVLLVFRSRFTRTGAPLQVLVSHNYDGLSDPNLADWTDLNASFSMAGDSNAWRTKIIDITAHKTQTLHLAFKYTSTAAAANKWDIDSVRTVTPVSVNETSRNILGLSVLGTAQSSQATIGFNSAHPCIMTVIIYDITGREISRRQLPAQSGYQRAQLLIPDLRSGLYFIHLYDGQDKAVAKLLIP